MENKIFTFEDIKNVGLSTKDSGEAFFEKLQITHDYAIIIKTGDFLTIIAKNGEKIIYNTTKLKSFSSELLNTIILEGDTPEKIDEMIDNFNGKDTFGILINKNGRPKKASEYSNIIDDPKIQQQFEQMHSRRNQNNDDYENR